MFGLKESDYPSPEAAIAETRKLGYSTEDMLRHADDHEARIKKEIAEGRERLRLVFSDRHGSIPAARYEYRRVKRGRIALRILAQYRRALKTQ